MYVFIYAQRGIANREDYYEAAAPAHWKCHLACHSYFNIFFFFCFFYFFFLTFFFLIIYSSLGFALRSINLLM